MRKLRPYLLIAAILALSPALAIPWAAPIFQRHCQLWHGTADGLKSCQIELADRLRTFKSGLRRGNWLKLRREPKGIALPKGDLPVDAKPDEMKNLLADVDTNYR